MTARPRLAIVAAAVAVVTIVLVLISPLRQTSGDTVPARIGGAVLRCAGSFDLSHVEWIAGQTTRGKLFYYMQRDQLADYTSIFGPAPAVVDAVALIGTGDELSDDTLRERERWGAAVLVAIAAALLVIAAAARQSLRRSAVVGLAAALSFAGAATLGQGLWQATVALPCLAGAIATLAWRDRLPRLAIITPALLALAVMIRPTIAPLVLGVGLAWAIPTRSSRTWIVAAVIALVAVAPLVAWNAIHLKSPLPIGQLGGNARVAGKVFELGGVGRGLAGLLASPSRGLVWFAPIVFVGVGIAIRDRRDRWIAGGIVLQLLAMATFFKWSGGLAYGPRLLAEATWVAIWLAMGTVTLSRRMSWIASAMLAITIAVGWLGLWRFDPDQWETRRLPESHADAYWDFVDSPIRSAIAPPATMVDTFDSPIADLRCEGRNLRIRR